MAFVLPPMRPGKNKQGVPYNQVTTLGSKGTWQSVSFESLDKVADSLDVAQEGGGIVSIPDVWAHCRFFEQALTEDGHPSQDQAVRQWRGLLALIALKPNLFYSLSTVSINLSGNDLSLFLKVLERTKPTATLAAGLVWSQIGVLYVSTGQSASVAGLVIPSTLVCPASTSALPTGTVPWVEEGRLSDPLKSSALNNEQLVALQKYVQKLRAAVQVVSKPDPVLQLAIKNRLDEFDRDLTTKTKVTAATFVDVALGIGVTGPLYDTLSTGIQIVTAPASSDVLLKSRIPKAKKNAILVDTTLASSSEGRVQVKIWDHITLEDYAGGLVTLDQLRQRARDHVVLTPDDVFETRLVKVAAASFNAHPDDFKEYLLPLKPTVLYYLSPEELHDGLRLKKGQGADEWVVEVDVPLTGRVHTMKRVYTKSDNSPNRIVDAKLPPTMARWPNFVAEDWNYYFLYYGGNPKKTKQFAPQAMFLKGIGVKLPGSAELRLRSHEQEGRTELYHATAPPEAMICQLPKDEAGPASATGLLLLPMGDTVGPKASGCTVGIDFGSISTSIYARVNGKSAPIAFQERFLYPYDLQEAGKVEIERQFLPPGTIDIPFQSLTKDRDSSFSSEKPDDTPFWAQFIYYGRKWDDTIAQIESNQLRSNLKWSPDPLDRERVQRFLAQCVLQTAAELVAAKNTADRVSLSQITWHVSYPEAFHDLEVDHYARIAGEAVRLVTSPSAAKELVKRPESLAAALYFVNRQDVAGAGTFSKPAVSIDVGGSTSDISIWQTNKEVWRTSLRLGGRDLIQAYLKQHPNLFAEIAPTATNLKKVAVELGKLSDDPSRDQAIACLIESEIFNEQISKRYGIVAAHPLIIQMVRVVEFGISGLLYYVAMGLKRLAKSEELKKEATQLTLCFAGRGSLLFTDTLDSERENAIKRLVADTSTLVSFDKVKIVKSKDPKHEVAFGLVQTESTLSSGVKGEGILGEIVRAGGTELGVDAPASKLEEHLDVEYEVGPLSNLEDFLSKYRSHFRRTLACEASDVVAEVQGTLTAERNALRARRSETGGGKKVEDYAEKLVSIEPPFIVGLRALVAKITNENIRIGP